jgi:hypothetical protein
MNTQERLFRVLLEPSDIDELKAAYAWKRIVEQIQDEIENCEARQKVLNHNFVKNLGVSVTSHEGGVTTTTTMTPEKYMVESACLAERLLVLQNIVDLPEFLNDEAEENVKKEEEEETDER